MASCTSITWATAALLPLFRHSSCASSSASRCIRSASFHSRFCRSRGRVRVQAESSNAWRAASTARSTSSGVARGTTHSTSPVAGLCRGMVWPSAASTQSPPMSMRGARWMNAEVAGSRFGSDMMKPRLVRVARSFAMAVPVVFFRPEGPICRGVTDSLRITLRRINVANCDDVRRPEHNTL
ncbi:hypothetical protein D9M71_529660 [compost metagenome]